ncbi:hypothetical protein CONCODRAFT_17089 [Conidiobolus coronatus NRRL 28638]|uniref:DUF1742-domain-containing protein n=1 Tax=Conidiobolus coronatus (strain ATCC 28846 / CBS 209.66 / NRRL 28638) TaxID=796925 RepID=A0A137P873_CONC2|nr:hypothetical protein CONCODRAFT_17089 [Conidiobolus coronatus NRRL 28638]|eukprot:KXN71144.1 hypothetical protein CONCODRAFT_17089 [Conidiobolus coronatus NRRL 28638]
MSSPLVQNQWELKTTKNEGTCFICSKFTTGCLVYKFGQIDWFFTCLSHLEDPGFARVLPGLDEPKSSNVKAEENKDSDNSKKDDKAKTDENSEKDKDKEDKTEEKKEEKPEEKKVPEVKLPKIYQLHRSILYLRENQLKLKSNKVKLGQLI